MFLPLGNDRRRFQRLSVNLTVWFSVHSPVYLQGAIPHNEAEVTTLNVSEGGIAFLTPYNIPVWSTLMIKIMVFHTDENGFVARRRPLEVMGEVRTNVRFEADRYRLGVSFRGLQAHQQQELADFLGTLARL